MWSSTLLQYIISIISIHSRSPCSSPSSTSPSTLPTSPPASSCQCSAPCPAVGKTHVRNSNECFEKNSLKAQTFPGYPLSFSISTGGVIFAFGQFKLSVSTFLCNLHTVSHFSHLPCGQLLLRETSTARERLQSGLHCDPGEWRNHVFSFIRN